MGDVQGINYPRRNLYGCNYLGAIFLGVNCPGEGGGNCPEGNCRRWELSGGKCLGGNGPRWQLFGGSNCLGGNFPGENCPVPVVAEHVFKS